MGTKLSLNKKEKSATLTIESPTDIEEIQTEHKKLTKEFDRLAKVTIRLASIDQMGLYDLQWVSAIILSARAKNKAIVLEEAQPGLIQLLALKTGFRLEQMRSF